jgi:fructosamine-3-kinase
VSRTIVKTRADAPQGFFEAEAAGLRWLGAARGARVAGVVAVQPGRIELERIDETRPTAAAAREFGAALARTHDAGADAFGAPPDGWTGPCFIGRRPLPVARERRWGVFYARDRVLPYAEVAVSAGNLPVSGLDLVRQACERIAAGEFDDDESPARIHGDLWNGNVLFGTEGVVLIDPAAHGGHRETDLAQLALFGAPFLDDLFAGYRDAHALADGWRERVPAHQLHILLVHAVLFGGGYARQALDAASTVG